MERRVGDSRSGTVVVGSFDELPEIARAVVAIGTFDGVHRGHRYLLSQARDRAHSQGDAFVVVTFTPNPQLVLRPGLRHFELTPAPVKVELLLALSPDAVVLLPFTTALAATSPDDFMEALEGRIGLREMWMGEDFAFGHKRSGNVAYLMARGRRSGFSVHVIPRQPHDDAPVSSTRIRQALADGDIVLARRLLGAPPRLLGAPGEALAAGPAAPERTGSVAFWVPVSQALPAAGLYDVARVGPHPVDPGGSHEPEAGARGVLVVPVDPTERDGAGRLELYLPPSGGADEREVQVALLDRRAILPGQSPSGGRVAGQDTSGAGGGRRVTGDG